VTLSLEFRKTVFGSFGYVVEKLRTTKPNFVIIVTDAFDGRIVANRDFQNIVKLPNIESLQGVSGRLGLYWV